MLLIITCKEDTTVTWFEETYLKRSGVPWRRFDTDLFPHTVGMSITGSEGHLSNLPSGDVSSKDIHAVWYRRPMTRTTDFSMLSTSGTYVENEIDAAMRSFNSCLDHAFWVDKPLRNIASSEKIRQLREARNAGFRVPDTIVTSVPDIVQELARRHDGRVIAKPLRRGGVVVDKKELGFFSSLLDLQMIRDHAASIQRCPLIFQEPIPKAFELRATVVGNRCFAVRLDSQDVPSAMVDWRKSSYKVRHSIFDLPGDVAEKCIRMTSESGLHFSAFDLIVTPEDEYVFLEHNPNGQFAWLEELTGIPIGGALLELFEQAVK